MKMSRFTYENKEKATKLETYEWDNVWMENKEIEDAKHLVYIGDSISCMTRTVITRLTDEKILTHGFGTSKALDNPYFYDSLKIFKKQLPKADAVILNNGLHGWHLSEDEYEKYYEDMILFLKEEFKGLPIFVLLTTYLMNEEEKKRVIERNKKALKIAEKYNLKVIDLYSVNEAKEELYMKDGVHFKNEGYEFLAKEIIEKISNII